MAYERSLDEAQEPLAIVCRHMRSKAIYVAGHMEPPADMQLAGSGHCWCSWTQHVFGPDEKPVDRRECNPGRSCYEAML